MTRTLALSLSWLLALGVPCAAFAQTAPAAPPKAAAASGQAEGARAKQEGQANQASPQPAAANAPARDTALKSPPAASAQNDTPKPSPRADAAAKDSHNQVRVRATMTVIDPRAGVDEIIGRLHKRELAPERKEPARDGPRSERPHGARGAAGPDRGEAARQDQRDARAAARDAQGVSRDARRDNRTSSPERSGGRAGPSNGSGPH